MAKRLNLVEIRVRQYISSASNLVNAGVFSASYTHYSTLATIEDIFNLGNLGRNDATATPMSALVN